MNKKELNNENKKILRRIASYALDYKLSPQEITTIIDDNKAMMLEAQSEGRSFLEGIDNNPKLYAYEVVNAVKGINHPSLLIKSLKVLTYFGALLSGISIAMLFIYNVEDSSYMHISKHSIFYGLNISLSLMLEILSFALGIFLLQNIHLKFRTWKLCGESKIEFIKAIFKAVIALVVLGILYTVLSKFENYEKTLVSINMLFIFVLSALIFIAYIILEKKK